MTTPITLTGPDNCAQCGAEIDVEAVLAAAMADGTVPVVRAYVTIRGHKVPIPGLYWDTACSEAIGSGSMEPGLTLEAARAFLNDIWGPQVAAHMLLSALSGDEEMAEVTADKLTDILEVTDILEIVQEALEAGDDLSWLPECDETDHAEHDHGGQDKSKAHLS